MTERIVVLGAGYGGSAAVRSLEDELDDENELVWIAEEDYHLLLHEVHRCIRTPDARESVTIPVGEIKDDDTRFVQATVTGIDVDDRTVELTDREDIDYDYTVVGLGSRTAFHGIDGLEGHALTVKSLGDALAINEHLVDATREASRSDPARVVVGGGGLTGIQVAGEVASWIDEHDAAMDVHLVEHSADVFPGHDHEFQGAIRNQLEAHDVEIDTRTAITAVEDDRIAFDERDPMEYDVLIWAGGVTGRDALETTDVDKDHNRLYTDATLETSDDRVFALGDSALVHQDAEGGPLTEEAVWETIVDDDLADVPPPTAEAAWEEGEHIGENVARAVAGRDRGHWAYMNKGTVVSIGDAAVAHDVIGIPINTFGGLGARIVKKAISARWIESITSVQRAARSWSDM
ncbi:NAD(P)/FAD-dependent oxidoreductase [Halococcus qingdaonensis]|uniref:NAD(P)/FAD-dependent oxidoreductase n=1 Tax=Halococcus qingdaonensis TaxID=224402 RepID=UPI00211722DD|nr:FAD-dependent oxidoreductase [Halococcus qingdaonensis]